MSDIKLWNWDKKPRTMLRYIKVGDIISFEIDKSGSRYGYGQLIAKLTAGHACKFLDIFHESPNMITKEEVLSASQKGKIFILDSYSTFDKKLVQEGEWRIIGHIDDYALSQELLSTTFFKMGTKGMYQRKNLLDETIPISDEEAKGYLQYMPVSGDQAKMWYLK